MLELVPGGSRLTEELVHQARTYMGIGPSPAVINVCRQMYLAGRFVVAEIDDLGQFEPGGFDAVVGGRCAIDGLDGERRRVLFQGVHRVLASGGLLIFSSHNAAAPELHQVPEQSEARRRGGLLRGLRLRSSRSPMDERDLGNELLSGIDGHQSPGPYRIASDAQAAQLGEVGFALLECIDLQGHVVPPDGPGSQALELHYVARPEAGD